MKIQTAIEVAAPINRAWEVLWSQFGEVDQWASGVQQSHAIRDEDGQVTGRVCLTDFGELQERVERLDPGGRTVTYSASGMPFPVRTVTNTWTLVSLGAGRTEVRSEIHMRLVPVAGLLMGWMMRPKFTSFMKGVLEELRQFVEGGDGSKRRAA